MASVPLGPFTIAQKVTPGVHGAASPPFLSIFLAYEPLLPTPSSPYIPEQRWAVPREGSGSPWSPGSCSVTQGRHSCLLTPQVKALGYDGVSPASVPSWLDSLGLQDYIHSFLSSGYSSIDTVKNLWELELVNVSAWGRLGPRGPKVPTPLTAPLLLCRS